MTPPTIHAKIGFCRAYSMIVKISGEKN